MSADENIPGAVNDLALQRLAQEERARDNRWPDESAPVGSLAAEAVRLIHAGGRPAEVGAALDVPPRHVIRWCQEAAAQARRGKG